MDWSSRLGRRKEGGEGGDNCILWSSFPGTVCAQEAGLAPARALQNSSSVESMSFGKVHSAQEPSKTEGLVASTLSQAL